ncbi:hypothetical protein ACFL2K_05395 [Candidatus Margulisiibacteriota bacterium]
MTNLINVVVIKDSVIEENVLVNSSEQAEEIFLDKCQEYIWNYDEYTAGDIEAILEQGYANFGSNSICISEPDIRMEEKQ